MHVSKLTKYLKPYTKQCIIGPTFKLIEAVLELYLPLVMARVIDQGIQSGDTAFLYQQGGLMLLLVVVGLLCALVCQYVASVTSQGFGTEVRNAVFGKILFFSHADLDKFGTASLINRVTGDINQLQLAVAMLIRLVIRAPFLCIGGIVMAVSINPLLSVILIVAIPLFVWIMTAIMKKTIPLHRRVQQKLDKLSLILRENMSGIRVIRAFARTEQEQTRFDEATDEHTKAAIRVNKISALLNPATQLIMNMAILAIVWFGGLQIHVGDMTTGEVVAFINYVNQILLALTVVANLVITFTKAYASAGRVLEVLETEPSLKETEREAQGNADAPAVEFRHVDFRYSDGDPALTDISFTAKRGETIGIIGGTGSGKSTLMHLLVRFYDVTAGSVMVEGENVRNYSLSSLRGKIGFVPQRVELFSGTIAENIRFGNADADDAAVAEAAKLAQAAEFIERMSKGYDSPVSRGGTNLSGGQRQRLAIARALVRKPSILILDDSSSALDYATDAALRKSIHQTTGDMTTFIISQRVSSVIQADRILVMDDGLLVGAGTHEELLQTCEEYREICSVQLPEQARQNGASIG